MRLIIELTEEEYEDIKAYKECYDFGDRIANGIQIPDNHGRLIDADAIPNSIELKGFLAQNDMHLVSIQRIKEALQEAPTVIEASKSCKLLTCDDIAQIFANGHC